MDERTNNSDCADQYGEPRLLAQTGASQPTAPRPTIQPPPVKEGGGEEVGTVGNRGEEEPQDVLVDEVLCPADELLEANSIKPDEEEVEEREKQHRERPPPHKKRNYAADEVPSPHKKGASTTAAAAVAAAVRVREEPRSISIRLGDVVWARLPNACYSPAVVTMDHFKFFTKIIKAEPGQSGRSQEEPQADRPADRKQYHVQFLADNRRHWLAEECVMAYKGIRQYEQMAINDVKNFYKIYKPKSEQLKNSWNDAVRTAEVLEALDPRERLRRCDLARLEDRGGKALIKKYENNQKLEEQRQGARPPEAAQRTPLTSPVMMSPKKNISPGSGAAESPRKGSGAGSHYNRKDEIEYKMHRLSEGGQARKRKLSSTNELSTAGTRPKPGMPAGLFEWSQSTPTFNKSFKIKKDRPPPESGVKADMAASVSSPTKIEPKALQQREPVVTGGTQSTSDNSGLPLNEEEHREADPAAKDARGEPESEAPNRSPASELATREEDDRLSSDSPDGVASKEEKSQDRSRPAGAKKPEPVVGGEDGSSPSDEKGGAGGYEPAEGALVWAKMRGYPYWPAVVARDPKNGEYVSLTDTFLKPIKKFHVLFLEYGNQRAWVTSSSIKQYKGINRFNSDKARATKSQRADYTPGKRYLAPFNRAVDYAEELRGGPDEDRLEKVLLRYGWEMVGEEDAASTPVRSTTASSGKKRRHSSGTDPPAVCLDSGKRANRSTESDSDGLIGGDPEVSEVNMEPTKADVGGSRPAAVGASGGRRSSAEAESRIDPDLDDSELEDRPQAAASSSVRKSAAVKLTASSRGKAVISSSSSKLSKRQSTGHGASVANGGKGSASSSESEETDDSGPPPTKKMASTSSAAAAAVISPAVKSAGVAATTISRPAAAQQKTPKSAGSSSKTARTPKANGSPLPAPIPANKTPAAAVPGADKDEFPRVGDLVWGRMVGFPYWPAFVTRSPQGDYRKENSAGTAKPSYHVQFFGWNDESGWVTSVIEFEGLEAFQQLAAKKKSDKSLNPAASLKKKWEKAARDAEDTLGLTRQERLDQYLVSYAHKLRAPVSVSPSSAGGKKAAAAAVSPARKPTASPAARQDPAATATTLPQAGRAIAHSKPSPASRKSAGGGLLAADVESGSSPRRSALPKGWRTETRIVKNKEVVVHISPDGKEFTSKAAAQRFISQERAGQGVKYLDDPTLPSGWKCQKIQSSTFFFSPMGERFESRRKVAERMRADSYTEAEIAKVLAGDSGRPAPKSVKIRRGETIEEDQPNNYEDDSDDESDQVKYLPDNVTKYRYGGPYDSMLDLEKLFDGPNVAGGIIDMVQLPDIFLRHPTVIVQESDNEMTISDVETGEFIAKKIIYD